MDLAGVIRLQASKYKKETSVSTYVQEASRCYPEHPDQGQASWIFEKPGQESRHIHSSPLPSELSSDEVSAPARALSQQ